jgi:S1-C subfamily serine protease
MCPPVSAAPLGPDFRQLSAEVLPTTVHIQAESGPAIAAGIQQMARDYSLPAPRHSNGQVHTSTGSGVIMNDKGLILTNHHVVNGATNIIVTLSDQRAYEATLVGHDPRTDVALLKIKGSGPFASARFDPEVGVAVGEWVIAVGHPFDFPFTVTAGIVSALGRRNLGRNEIQDYIQTDVAVNPGSSGGPLFNTTGHLVGINTAIFSPDKENLASAGISFAIPASMALRVGQELMEFGRVRYAGIGAKTEDAKPTEKQPQPGARVSQVLAGSPAEKAGLRRGDVIVAADGEAISSGKAFEALILTRAINTTIELTIRRGSRTHLTHAKTVDSSQVGPKASPTDVPSEASEWAGLTLVDADPKRLMQMGISLPPDTHDGVLVLSVKTGSIAEKAGLVAGDVLLSVQKTPVTGVDGLLKSVENHSVVLVSFWRGKNRYLAALANGV